MRKPGDLFATWWEVSAVRLGAGLIAFALILAALSLGVRFVPAMAQGAPSDVESRTMIKSWERTLNEAEIYLDSDQHNRERHEELRQAISEVIPAARALSLSAAQAIEKRQAVLDALGPKPAEGQPAETAEIAAQRSAYESEISALRARASQADVIVTRARADEQNFAAVFRQQLIDGLAIRLPAPFLDPSIGSSMGMVVSVVGTALWSPVGWLASLTTDQWKNVFFHWQSLVLAVLLGLGIVAQRYLIRRFGPDSQQSEPSYKRRLVAAFARGTALSLLPAALFALVYFWARDDASPIPAYAALALENFSTGLGSAIVIIAFLYAGLSPNRPEWRCVPLTPAASRILFRRLTILALLLGVHRFVVNTGVEGHTDLVVSPQAKALYATIFAWMAGPLMIAATRDSAWRREPRPATKEADAARSPAAEIDGETPPEPLLGGHSWKMGRMGIATLIGAGMLAATAGYVRLGYYLIDNITATAIVFGVIFLLHNAVREAIALVLSLSAFHRRLRLTDSGREDYSFWSSLLIDVLLLGLGIILVAPSWGIERETLIASFRDVAAGFRLGNITVSLVDIVEAFLLLPIGMFITRLVKNAVADQVLTRTSLDSGVRNSIVTGVGYFGVTLSILISIAALGIDMSNLAILGGALGVGIGFGLQNIVNNFVSGLILLVERPIKVGDLVVVGGQTGYVRRISVRATEIETFERAAVIVPNAEFISQEVVNWTHSNRLARIDIKLGVAYGSDPETVITLMLEAARNHHDVVSWPQPSGFFVDFGASSLDFVLFAYVADVDKRLSVASALRIAINKAFIAAEIDIPFSQRDIHLKDIDRLEKALRKGLIDKDVDDIGGSRPHIILPSGEDERTVRPFPRTEPKP